MKATSVENYIKNHWDQSVHSQEIRPNVDPIPVSHTTPCIDGKFVVLFYWDTYFTNLGLLAQDRIDLARSNCDAIIYLIHQKGFVPNSTFKGNDTRSQQPYFSMMVRDVYAVTKDKEWLSQAIEALKTEYTFWMEKRITPIGLNRHYHHADQSYLLFFFESLLTRRLGLSADSDEEKMHLAEHYLSEAETGWDFTPRFGSRCDEFVHTELNSCLYFYEKNFAWFSQELGEPMDGIDWKEKAGRRKEKMNRFLWDESEGLFLDYDFVNHKHSSVASLGAYHPLWSGLATMEQAQKACENLQRFLTTFGITVCEKRDSHIGAYQWDFPNGWPPLFYTTVMGLHRYGFIVEARKIAKQFIQLTENLYQKTGKLWEKFDVTTGEIAGGEYKAEPMLGWTAGVYLALLNYLKENEIDMAD